MQAAQHLVEVGVVGRRDRRERLDAEARPSGPIAHLARHVGHEAVATIDQGLGMQQGEAVGSHRRRDELGRLARHDEAGEPFVDRQHDERRAQLQHRLIAARQMSVERRGEEHARERTVVLPELEHRFADAGIGLAHTPEILADRVHVVRLDPQSQPRREIHARHAAGRTVGPAETGKVRVPLPAGKSLDVGRVAVGQDERIGRVGFELDHGTGFPLSWSSATGPGGGPPCRVGFGMFSLAVLLARVWAPADVRGIPAGRS